MARRVPNIAWMGDEELHKAIREARLEAAPFALAVSVANVLLALVSWSAGWELFTEGDWWIWLLVALPSLLLFGVFALGSRSTALDRTRRELAIALLVLVGIGAGTGISCVIASLLTSEPEADQLLASAAVVVLTNVVTFGLFFWELDAGGPVARALASSRVRPDFQFPQDENPHLAEAGWAPALLDYAYVSVTNSFAFSPTDVMPLTQRAKVFMALEATISALTVLLVAARAINALN